MSESVEPADRSSQIEHWAREYWRANAAELTEEDVCDADHPLTERQRAANFLIGSIRAETIDDLIYRAATMLDHALGDADNGWGAGSHALQAAGMVVDLVRLKLDPQLFVPGAITTETVIPKQPEPPDHPMTVQMRSLNEDLKGLLTMHRATDALMLDLLDRPDGVERLREILVRRAAAPD